MSDVRLIVIREGRKTLCHFHLRDDGDWDLQCRPDTKRRTEARGRLLESVATEIPRDLSALPAIAKALKGSIDGHPDRARRVRRIGRRAEGSAWQPAEDIEGRECDRGKPGPGDVKQYEFPGPFSVEATKLYRTLSGFAGAGRSIVDLELLRVAIGRT